MFFISLFLFLIGVAASTYFTFQLFNILFITHAEYVKGKIDGFKIRNDLIKAGQVIATVSWTITIGVALLMINTWPIRAVG